MVSRIARFSRILLKNFSKISPTEYYSTYLRKMQHKFIKRGQIFLMNNVKCIMNNENEQ
jgi:hypothetical protein